MRVYLTAQLKPLTACDNRSLANIVADGRWADEITNMNGATAAEMTDQCAVILLARERGLMPETI